jgi:hypothetical protein
MAHSRAFNEARVPARQDCRARPEREGISIEEFIATAAAEKMATLLTEDYLRREARLGLRADFERVSYSSSLVLVSRARARNPEC